MNWKTLLAALAAQGYAEANPTVDSVKAFVTTKNLDLQGEDGKAVDVDALYAATQTKTTLVLRGADELTEADYEAVRKARAGIVQQNRGKGFALIGAAGAQDETPQRFSIGNAEGKSFNAKANRGETIMPDADSAAIVGAWGKLATFAGKDFPERAECESICTKANVSYDFASGGFAVPEIMSSKLISIRPKYSALAQLMADVPLPPQGESVPRRSSGMTVYSPAEGAAPTESNPTGDQVKLTPIAMSCLATVTKTQLAKSIINFGEFIVSEATYAIAKKSEEIFINGDGSSTYFNQMGLLGKLSKQVVDAGGTWLIGTNATNAEYHSGTVRGAGGTWAALTYANFADMVALPADVENSGNLRWLVNRSFYYGVMVPLATSKGGVTRNEVLNGITVPMYEGFPVIFSNAMPAVSAVKQVCAYFGEFDAVAKVGAVVSGMEMSVSTERYWELGKVGYKLDVARAFNCHDLGTANSTKPAQTTPFAALVTAES